MSESAPTDPRISIVALKAQARKAAKANRLNLGLVLGVLGIVGGAYLSILSQSAAAAQTQVQAEVVPLRARIDGLDVAVKAQAHGQARTDAKLERVDAKLDALLMRFGVPQPPLAVLDGGAP